MALETNAISSAYQTYLNTIASQLGVPMMVITTAIALIAIWTFVWKGTALWKSARKSQPIWFVILLIVNTIGILEILYIFIFSKMGTKKIEKFSGSRKSLIFAEKQVKAEAKPAKKNQKK